MVKITRLADKGGPLGNTYQCPSGNSYTFHLGETLNILPEEDVEFFRKREDFEVESIGKKIEKTAKKLKEAITEEEGEK
ncbi:MAG: hypothetical protein AB1467_06780 [Candidatus Diapherotrites archaeon]